MTMLALEATCASTSTNETVCYTVRDAGDFGFSRRIERRVIAANAVMRRDYDHSGFVTASDTAFAEAHGMGAHAWPMPPSSLFLWRSLCSSAASATGGKPGAHE